MNNVAIIGAGPVGLFSIFACGMLRLPCTVFDTLPHAGGQCQELYPEKPIYDIPGFPAISGGKLVDNLLKQAKPFAPLWRLDTSVEKIEKIASGWRLHAKNKVEDFASIIIAGGAGSFEPMRPPLNNLGAFEKKSVFYGIKNKKDYEGKNIVIAGGGDSAVDWAINLSALAKSVTLVHRREKFRAAPESLALLAQKQKEGALNLCVPYQLKALEGNEQTGQLHRVIVANLKNEPKTLPADNLLPFFGLKNSLGAIENWGLDMFKNKININPCTGETNLSGVYAVGDIAHYPFKRKLILSGFAEAAQAAASIRRQLFPDELTTFGHSTSTGIPSLAS